jgi:predicted N-acetyltransferase YhbS
MDKNMIFREAIPRDRKSVELLLLASYSELLKNAYGESVLAAALPSITMANPTLLSCGTFFVVCDSEGDALGCGGWTHQRPGTNEMVDGVAHIRHFAVHPKWIGHGIGRSLYERCESQAREANVKTFKCYSTLNAERFYAALGFRKIATEEIELTPTTKFPIVSMCRSI